MKSLAVRIALVAGAGALGACGDDGGGGRVDARPPDGFDRGAMLRHLADAILVPAHEAAAARTAALTTALDVHCGDLDAGRDATASGAAARAAWGEAMDAWEVVETMLIGPAAMDSHALRDRIYAWPLVATCGIDRDVVAIWTDPASYDAATRLNNVRSLAAIEYALHPPAAMPDAHTCPIVPAGWVELGADRPRARCRLARALAADVAATAEAVAQAWRPGGGDYANQLAAAGTPASSIPTAQEAVNRVSDSLFYLDRFVKDMKLGEAAGIVMNACGTVQMPCEREIELRFADRSVAALRINLRSFRQVFTGTVRAGDAVAAEGPSFEDFLRAVGATELADRMVANIDAALAAADALPDSFRAALADDYAAVVATHTAIRAITDDLKSQFLTTLALEIPDDVAADND